MATDSVKFYTLIYVALVVLVTISVILERRLEYWTAVSAILVISGVKTVLIVGYFQHLRWENPSLTALMAQALGLFLLLMVAASYSIT